MEAPKHLDSAPTKPQENFAPEVVNLALNQMKTAAYKKRFDKLGITLKSEDFYTKAGLKTDNVGSLNSVNTAFGLSLRVADISYSGANEKYKITAAKNNALVAVLRWHLEHPEKSFDESKAQIQQKIVKLQKRVDEVLNQEKKVPCSYTTDLVEAMKKVDLLLKDLSVKVAKETNSTRLNDYMTILDFNESLASLFGTNVLKPTVEPVARIQGSYAVDGNGAIRLTDSKGNSFVYNVVKPPEIQLFAANTASACAVVVADGVSKGVLKQDASGKWRSGVFTGKASIWDSYDVVFGNKITIVKKQAKVAPAVVAAKAPSAPKKSPEDFHGVLKYGSAEWKEWAEGAERVSTLIMLAGDDSGSNEDKELKKTLGAGLAIVKIEGGRWCQPCNRVKPFIGEVEKEYTGKIKFFDAAVFGGAGSVIPFLFEKKYGVKSFTTFLVFKNGKLQEKIDDVRIFGLSGSQTAIDLDKTRAIVKKKLDSL